GFSGTVFLTSANPRFNQASVLVGSDTALGTGVVFPASGLQLGSDGGPHTLANRFITQDLRLSGGNDLTLAGPLDLNSGATYTVFAPINFTLAGGVGEFTPNSGITKNGPGFLNLTGASLFSGGITIGADGGTFAVSGAGTLPNVGNILVNIGGSFVIDNTASANNDRVRNAASIHPAGGAPEVPGEAGPAGGEDVRPHHADNQLPSPLPPL